jgi:hypothetical protein
LHKKLVKPTLKDLNTTISTTNEPEGISLIEFYLKLGDYSTALKLLKEKISSKSASKEQRIDVGQKVIEWAEKYWHIGKLLSGEISLDNPNYDKMHYPTFRAGLIQLINTSINELMYPSNSSQVTISDKPTPTPQGSKEGWEVLSCKWNGEVYDASELPKDDFRLKEFIFYVKRISDGQMFHVGQLHNGKTIEKFFIGWKGMEIHYTDGSGVLFTTEEPFLPKLPTPQGSKEGWEIVTAKSKNGDIHDFIPEGNKKGSVPCFKMEEPCKAFSVRRISDNEVFSVGEDVSYINDIKEILSWSIREDGMIYAEMLEDIFFPITRLNKVLNNSNPQGSKEGWEVLTWFSREGEVAVLVGWEIEGNLKAGYTIRSVRRNSDGEVFTVGDNIGWGCDGRYETILTGFVIKEGRLKFNYDKLPDNNYPCDFLDAVRLHKKPSQPQQGNPLFTTEDGVEIKEVIGYVWMVNHCYEKSERSVFDTIRILKEWEGKEITFKLFSTKSAAEQYINLHKPKYSVQSILDRINGCVPDEIYYEIKEIIK